MKYKNPLNMKIFELVVSVFGWPLEPNSKISDLPLNEKFYETIEGKLSMDVRGNRYSVKASRDCVTIGDLVGDLDFQYTKNYFQSENGTYNGLIDVSNYKGEKISGIEHKWKIRGKNLIERIRKMQAEKPDLQILDLGCGYNLYKKHLDNVTGVDPYIESVDYLCRVEDFEPPQKYDIVICFGPMNWYTFDLQVRNMKKIKECLADTGVCYWSHVHNYYKVYQEDAVRAHTWKAGTLEDAFRNNAFYFYDRQWKYNQYFNWTEEALETISGFCGLSTGEMQYDDCGCYRPPMWRLFCELRHKEI
jgi:hypothetical protein